ncbi:MAG: cytochrome c [Calditrichaeota bacterium]|nr:cytochrome c [Calditrichota bacterium]
MISPAIRKWTPFVALMLIVLFATAYLLFSGQKSAYRPGSDNPVTIYKEACSACHGQSGKSSNLFYPDLDNKTHSIEEVTKIIKNGGLFMPAFPKIKGDTLSKLARYVTDKQFLKR